MILLRAIRAEFMKIFTTRMWWVLMVILFAYVAFTAGILAGVFGGLGEQLGAAGGDVPTAPPTDIHLLVYSVASTVGYVFPVMFGALVTTSEFRHQSLTPTFLATPRRVHVLSAKAISAAVVGGLYGVAALAGSVGIGASILAATGNDAALGDTDTWQLMARMILAMALWAVIGVGLGALIPSQVAAIVVVLAFTQLIEPILRLGPTVWEWTGDVVKFLPGAASDALVGSSIFSSFGGGDASISTLDWWQGGLVLLAIALVASAAGHFTSWRRDVT